MAEEAGGPRWKNIIDDKIRCSTFKVLSSQDYNHEGLYSDYDDFLLKIKKLPWKPKYSVGGNVMLRQTIWITLGGCSCKYFYAGEEHSHFNCPKWLENVTSFISELVDVEKGYLNCINGNHYKDGNQKLGSHSDDEPLFETSDKRRLIVSLSIGQQRNMLLTEKSSGVERRVPLKDLDVAVMDGFFQSFYTHAVEREPSATGERFNFTWRHIERHQVACKFGHN